MTVAVRSDLVVLIAHVEEPDCRELVRTIIMENAHTA